MKKKKIKIKWKNIIAILIFLICIISLFIVIIDILNWKKDSQSIDKQIEEIKNIVEVEEVKETDETDEIEIIEQEEEIPESNPYWDYIKMNLINVNFSKLKEINSDTKGWITVNGTNINYPFVQSKDNKYYLTHSFNKSYNNAGWVFLDYRNNINSLSKNTIIYAHARLDSTMFGTLKNTLKKNWLKNTDNHVVKISTEKENTLWQVFSVYHIPTTNDYIKTNFTSNEEFKNWSEILINRSIYNFNTTINENDKIITLSTCYKNDEKIVLHAKLIKKKTRY